MTTFYVIGAIAFLVYFIVNTFQVQALLDRKVKPKTDLDIRNIESREKMIGEMKDMVGDRWKPLYWSVIAFTAMVGALVWPVTFGFIIGFHSKNKK